jgi:hypothetical protein
LGTLVVVVTVLGVFFLRKEFYFPALVLYVAYGLAKTVLFGLMDRRPRGDSPVIDDDDEPLTDESRQRRRRRKRRHHPPSPGFGSPDAERPPGGA